MGPTHRFPPFVIVGLSGLIVLTAESAAAQEVELRGPLVAACPALLMLDSIPANLEWSYWVTGGGGLDSTGSGERFGVLGAGVEATTQLGALGTKYQYGGLYEFRGGPWWNVVSDFRGARAEGGYVLSFGQIQHAQWGTYTVRVGGGMGDDRLGLSPHFVVTLTGGIRYAGERYSERGACDPKPGPKALAMADHFRLFASARSNLADGAPWQFTFGVEFSPTFFLPPYSLGKWIGARP
jgi:hypothetical protein